MQAELTHGALISRAQRGAADAEAALTAFDHPMVAVPLRRLQVAAGDLQLLFDELTETGVLREPTRVDRMREEIRNATTLSSRLAELLEESTDRAVRSGLEMAQTHVQSLITYLTLTIKAEEPWDA